MKSDRTGRLWVGAAMLCVAVALQGCTTGTRAVTGSTQSAVITPLGEQGQTAEAQVRTLNMRITADGADAAGRDVAGQVASEVKSTVLGKGFTISEEKPDVLVGIKAAVSEFDRSGNYYRHDGTLDATVSLPRVGREVGQKRFSERGERKLGEADSLKAVAAKLAEPAATWLQEVSGGISRDIVATDLTIKRTRIHQRLIGTAREEDAKYAAKFAARVGAIDGIIACELAEQDYAKRLMVFRILYYRKSFPQGLLNHLVGISELGIEP